VQSSAMRNHKMSLIYLKQLQKIWRYKIFQNGYRPTLLVF